MDGKQSQEMLETQLKDILGRRRVSSTLRKLTLPGTNQVDFSSNDFLSLASSPQLKALFQQELQNSNLPLGSGGSRLLDGNSQYAENLERDIAQFHRAETGLLFNSGFDANAGFFSSVPQPGDVIVYDQLVHASVHDGMRLSRAGKTIAFKHNSVDDLRAVLQSLLEEAGFLRREQRNVFVAVESIYSMDGDVAPLSEIVNTVEGLIGTERGFVIVDEAHSTGVLGPSGSGLVCALGLENRIFARLHTFGKALASSGAIILGSSTLREYLVNFARPLIYTTFMSYPALVSIRCSYTLLRTGKTVPLQDNLHSLTQSFFECLTELRKKSLAARRALRIPSACPQSPIFAIQVEQPRQLASCLQSHCMMIRAVVAPTVPVGTERVRVCLHAGNTISEIQTLVRVLGEWCESLMLLAERRDEDKGIAQSRL